MTVKKTKTTTKQKIRIKLKSFDYRLADQAGIDIVEAAKRSGANVAGPIPLPMNIKKFCVNRSPHINKKSSDQFEIRFHSRLIDIFEPTADTVDSLKKLNLPAGVEIKIDLMAA
ncbi:MAG: 30S ribosomal protein S10 [Puniceicoccales bacterium]|jgi:small subunit ribosomal protein S10|nr:30S ribosomal protein S10 [Puniceicoccales bacterium]MDR1232784.1 30S ribosomal protein S10 [Puniceicoccales bacterium]